MTKKNHVTGVSKPDVLVSVLLISFNHERYLRCALDSVVMQDTNFKYEVLVHDDASQDNSQSIIDEYEDKYPNLIISLKRTENVYSKGDRLSIWRFFVEQSQGEYIAFCEGDDYWSSKNKLKKQVSGLMNELNCNISFHPTIRLNVETGSFCGSYGDYSDFDSNDTLFIPFVSASNFFMTNTVHISSIMIRRSSFLSFYHFFEKYPWLDASDHFIKLIGVSAGALYLRDAMSVYRECVPGSWTSVRESNINLKVLHCIKMISLSQGISNLSVNGYSVIGRSHLLRYTLELHSLLHSISALAYLNEFYSLIENEIRKTLILYPSHEIIYFGAGTIFDALIGDDRNIISVIDRGRFYKLKKRHVLSSCELEEYSFKKNDVIVITPIFRGHSIRASLSNALGLDCHFVIVDDLLTLDLISKSILSSAQRFLVERGLSEDDVYLNTSMN